MVVKLIPLRLTQIDVIGARDQWGLHVNIAWVCFSSLIATERMRECVSSMASTVMHVFRGWETCSRGSRVRRVDCNIRKDPKPSAVHQTSITSSFPIVHRVRPGWRVEEVWYNLRR